MSPETASRRAGDLRFLRDIVFLAISPIVLRARSFLLIPVIVRVLGVEGYGIWTQFEVTLALAVTVVSLNFGMGINRLLVGEVPIEQLSDDITSALCVQLVLGALVITPVLIWPSWFAGLLFGSPGIWVVSVALAVSILCSLVGNCFWGMMRAQRHTQAIALINSLRWWGELIVIVAALLITGSVEVLFISLAAYQLLANAVYPLYAIRKGWFTPVLPRFTRTREYLRFSLPLFGQNLGYWLVNSSDKYVVRWLLGIEALGVYGALYKFGSIIMLVMEPIVEVLLPDTAALYDKHRLDEMQRRFRLTLRYFGILAAATTVGVVGSSRLLVTISGLDTADIRSHALLLAWLAAGGLAMGFGRILHDLLYIKGQTSVIGGLWIGLGVLNTLINFSLIPWLGILGAAIATALTFLASLFVVAAMIRRMYPEFSLWREWSGAVGIALFAGLGVALLCTKWLPWLLPIGSIIGMVVFLAILVSTDTLGRREIEFVRVVLASRRRGSLQEQQL